MINPISKLRIFLFSDLIIIIQVILWMPIISSANINDSLTIEQTVKLVIDHHPTLIKAAGYSSAAEARVGIGKSAYYPGLNADLSYANIGPTVSIPLMGHNFELYPANNYDAHLSLDALLYDFGKRGSMLKLLKAGRKTINDGIAISVQSLSYRTLQACYSVLFLRKSVSVQDEAIASLNGHRDMVKRKVESGTSTEYEVLTTEVRISEAQSRKIDLACELSKNNILLSEWTALPLDKINRLSGNFNLAPPVFVDDSLIAVALRTRPEAKTFRDIAEAANLAVRISAKDDVPTLSAHLAYGAKNGYLPNMDKMQQNWTASAAIKFPIFDGHRTHFREIEARANADTAAAAVTETELRIKTEVRQAIEDVRAAYAKMTTSALQVKQAESSVNMARIKYESGVITNFDLLDAETAFAQARLQDFQNQYRYALSRAVLDQAIGKTAVDR